MTDLNEQNNENIEISSNEFTVGTIVSNSFGLAMKNAGSIFLITLIYYLTIWIPYINLGTTIAIYAFVIALARNEKFEVGDLFAEKYRKLISPILLCWGVSFLAILFGFFFFIVPGIVLMTAWGMGSYLIVDKNLEPMDALKTSYKLTYGKKWTIALSFIVVGLMFAVVSLIVEIPWQIYLNNTDPWRINSFALFFYTIVSMILSFIQGMVMMAMMGYQYNELSKNI